MGRWEKLRRLPWRERRVLGEAVIVLPISQLLLRYAGLQRTQALLSALTDRRVMNRGSTADLDRARGLAELVAAAVRHGPYPGTCLSRSVALWCLLRREGMAAQVCLGASRRGGEFAAHAWVEWNGYVLTDGEGVRQAFAPFRHVGSGAAVTEN